MGPSRSSGLASRDITDAADQSGFTEQYCSMKPDDDDDNDGRSPAGALIVVMEDTVYLGVGGYG